MTRQGTAPNLARHISSVSSCSPSAVPLSGMTMSAAYRSRSRSPGRSGRRDRWIEPQGRTGCRTMRGGPGADGRPARGRRQPVEHQRVDGTRVVDLEHGVDQALAVEVLGDLDTGRELPVVEAL